MGAIWGKAKQFTSELSDTCKQQIKIISHRRDIDSEPFAEAYQLSGALGAVQCLIEVALAPDQLHHIQRPFGCAGGIQMFELQVRNSARRRFAGNANAPRTGLAHEVKGFT